MSFKTAVRSHYNLLLKRSSSQIKTWEGSYIIEDKDKTCSRHEVLKAPTLIVVLNWGWWVGGGVRVSRPEAEGR